MKNKELQKPGKLSNEQTKILIEQGYLKVELFDGRHFDGSDLNTEGIHFKFSDKLHRMLQYYFNNQYQDFIKRSASDYRYKIKEELKYVSPLYEPQIAFLQKLLSNKRDEVKNVEIRKSDIGEITQLDLCKSNAELKWIHFLGNNFENILRYLKFEVFKDRKLSDINIDDKHFTDEVSFFFCFELGLDFEELFKNVVPLTQIECLVDKIATLTNDPLSLDDVLHFIELAKSKLKRLKPFEFINNLLSLHTFINFNTEINSDTLAIGNLYWDRLASGHIVEAHVKKFESLKKADSIIKFISNKVDVANNSEVIKYWQSRFKELFFEQAIVNEIKIESYKEVFYKASNEQIKKLDLSEEKVNVYYECVDTLLQKLNCSINKVKHAIERLKPVPATDSVHNTLNNQHSLGKPAQPPSIDNSQIEADPLIQRDGNQLSIDIPIIDADLTYPQCAIMCLYLGINLIDISIRQKVLKNWTKKSWTKQTTTDSLWTEYSLINNKSNIVDLSATAKKTFTTRKGDLEILLEKFPDSHRKITPDLEKVKAATAKFIRDQKS